MCCSCCPHEARCSCDASDATPTIAAGKAHNTLRSATRTISSSGDSHPFLRPHGSTLPPAPSSRNGARKSNNAWNLPGASLPSERQSPRSMASSVSFSSSAKRPASAAVACKYGRIRSALRLTGSDFRSNLQLAAGFRRASCLAVQSSCRRRATPDRLLGVALVSLIRYK